MKIIKPDSFLAYYAFEKKVNPQKKLWWMKVRRKDVEDIDSLVELSHNRDSVETQKDWDVIEALLKFFIVRWPIEFAEFKKTVPQIRSTRRRGGYTENKEMMYLASLPPRFERLIKAVFPRQQFDKEFIYKLIRKYKIFSVGGES
jgi:hypothetical protein